MPLVIPTLMLVKTFALNQGTTAYKLSTLQKSKILTFKSLVLTGLSFKLLSLNDENNYRKLFYTPL